VAGLLGESRLEVLVDLGKPLFKSVFEGDLTREMVGLPE
jgi:hypothetical protein